MKKKFAIEGIDCANCAAKMQLTKLKVSTALQLTSLLRRLQ